MVLPSIEQILNVFDEAERTSTFCSHPPPLLHYFHSLFSQLFSYIRVFLSARYSFSGFLSVLKYLRLLKQLIPELPWHIFNAIALCIVRTFFRSTFEHIVSWTAYPWLRFSFSVLTPPVFDDIMQCFTIVRNPDRLREDLQLAF